MSRLARLFPDRFTLYLICTVIIASIAPAHGQGVEVFGWITNIAVGLLFSCTARACRARPSSRG